MFSLLYYYKKIFHKIKGKTYLNILKRIELVKKFYYVFTILLFIFLIQNLYSKTSFVYPQDNSILVYNDINYYYQNKEYFEVAKESASEIRSHILDIYQPKNCTFSPVIMYIHGGTWVLGDKGRLSDKVKAFTSQKYIYVSINYRLSPDYSFPAHAQDVARAFSWVKNNIDNYGGKPEQIYLLGHSAGGHLAALIALDEQYLAPFGLTPSDISGVIGLDSAAYHLPSLFAAESENQYLFSWAFGNNPEDWEKASPINYIREGTNVTPFLLLVAGDRQVSETVNVSFYQKLVNNGYNATLLKFKDKDHVSIDFELGSENDPVFSAILNWLKEY